MKLSKAIKTGIKVAKVVDKYAGGGKSGRSKKSERVDDDTPNKTECKRVLKLAALEELETLITTIRNEITQISVQLEQESDEDEEDFQERIKETKQEEIENICGKWCLCIKDMYVTTCTADDYTYDVILVSEGDIQDFYEDIANNKIKSLTIAKKIWSEYGSMAYDEAYDYYEGNFLVENVITTETNGHKSSQQASNKPQVTASNTEACGCMLLTLIIIIGLFWWIIG